MLVVAAFGTNNPMLSQFVFCSTADVYGTQLDWIPVCEDHPTRPVGRYGEKKLAAERVLQAHAAAAAAAGDRAFPLTIMRPASVYGEVGSSATLLDPLGRGDGQWVEDMRNGKPVVVAGAGGILTQFMHAENAAEAFVGVLGQAHTHGKIYNVCPKDMHSWSDVRTCAICRRSRFMGLF